MRITKEKAGENRAALVQAASRLIRKHGIDGIGVAEISKEAGLTHGALYAHFASKEALAAEAMTYGLVRGHKAITAAKDGCAPTLADHLELYVSASHRDNMAGGCPMSAAASEIARQDSEISARFTEGFMLVVDAVERALDAAMERLEARQRALTIVASMIGAVGVARSVLKANPALSDEILAGVRGVLCQLGGAPGARSRSRKPAKSRVGRVPVPPRRRVLRKLATGGEIVSATGDGQLSDRTGQRGLRARGSR
jgi:TetR/AcrR family transcriptional repressor of nem operon